MDDTTETRSATCYVYRMDVIRTSHKIGDPGSLTRIEKCFFATCVSYPELGIGQFRKKNQSKPFLDSTQPNPLKLSPDPPKPSSTRGMVSL